MMYRFIAALLLVLVGIPAEAQSVYSQNFESIAVGSLPSGCTSITGTWAVTSTNPVSGSAALAGGAADGNTISCTGGGPLADMSVRYDVNYQAYFAGVYLRADAALQNGYVLIPNNIGLSAWSVYKRVSGTYTQIGSIPNSGLLTGLQQYGPGSLWSIRAQIQGSTISFRIWTFGQTEPTTWAGQVTDTSITAPGYWGFYNNSNGGGNATVDNVAIYNLDSSGLTAGTSSSSNVMATTATVTNTGASGGTAPYSYQWYRSTTSGFTPGSGNIVSGATNLTLNDTGLVPSTSYYYVDVATDSASNTAASSQLTVTTTSGANTIAVTNAALFWSPGNWDHLTTGIFGVSKDTMQATAPGAYLKFNVTGTANLAIDIDNATNSGFPSGDMPILRYSINGAAFTDVQLSPSQTTLTLSTGLTTGTTYSVEVDFKASSNTNNYGDVWGSSGVSPTNVVRIHGVTIDSGGSVSAPTLKPKRVLIFGDSITAGEHANTDGSDDATASFAGSVALSLNAEYGQLGYGGQGWTVTGGSNAVPFLTTWNQYSSGRTRSLSGLDYVVIVHGGNDLRGGIGGSTIQSDAQSFLPTLRAAVGANTLIFITVECMGAYETNLQAAVAAYKASSGDTKTYFIDATSLFPAGVFTINFNYTGNPFEWTYDGVHPLDFGHSRIAAAYSALIGASMSDTVSNDNVPSQGRSQQIKRAR